MWPRPLKTILLAAVAFSLAPVFLLAGDTTYRIAGGVMEVRSGVRDVVVILCDQKSGLPVSADTFLPFVGPKGLNGKAFPPKLVTSHSGARGSFSFTNVPAGEYRLVAQKWIGPFKGVFEVHGSVIQLFGVADHVRVPSPEAEKIVLTPAGDGVLKSDLEVGNDGTLMVLSTQPMQSDPILGFHAAGTNFLSHALGLNVMPAGRTTVLGVPQGTIHAWFFANDNNPGFTGESYEMREPFLRAPRIPFVASWSDGRHEPPARLKELSERLKQQNVSPQTLLGINETLPGQEQYEQSRKLMDELTRLMPLPNGESVCVGDLLALVRYEALAKRLQKR